MCLHGVETKTDAATELILCASKYCQEASPGCYRSSIPSLLLIFVYQEFFHPWKKILANKQEPENQEAKVKMAALVSPPESALQKKDFFSRLRK